MCLKIIIRYTHFILGSAADVVAKYGVKAVKKGLMRMGFDETTINKALKGLDDGGSPNVCSNRVCPELGRKLEFIFGNATGSKHNIDRSIEMERQLNAIGILIIHKEEAL